MAAVEAVDEVEVEAGHEDLSDGGPSGRRRRAVTALVPRLALWAVVLVLIGGFDPEPALSLMLVAVAGVVTIVSDARFEIERRIEEWGFPTREAWVPLMMLVVLFGFDLIDTGRIGGVVQHEGPIIVFILAFALVSEGLGRSGFFHFLAYRLAERGGANTTRLILYLFLLSSVLTYVTSNDIVVLTMTPIVLSVAYQARIANAKLLLLSQFIAANTVSMGLLIGSPTNLILGRALDLGFVEYFLLMFGPSVMALMGTFVVVTWINRLVERVGAEQDAPGGELARELATKRRKQGRTTRAVGRFLRGMARRLVGTWTFPPSYATPRFAEHRSFTRDMRQWISVFAVAVVLLALGAGSASGLLRAALAIGVLGIVCLRLHASQHGESTGLRFVGRLVQELPIGIVFFGMTYFVIADAIAHQPFVRAEVNDTVAEAGSTHTPWSSWPSIVTTGVLVNTMNDLPAAALTGDVLGRVEVDGAEARATGGQSAAQEGRAGRSGTAGSLPQQDEAFDTPFDKTLVTQGVLVGLNIGTYVTPVGALAGIIWFNVLRKERQRRHALAVARGAEPFDVVMPDRRDLIVYGGTMFLAMAFLLGATNFGFVALADWLTGPLSGRTGFSEVEGHVPAFLACLGLAGLTVAAFARALRRHGVVLTHLADLLFLMIKVRLWAARHRVVASFGLFVVLFMVSATLVYHIESFHDAHYSDGGTWDESHRSEFQGPMDFVFWLYVFITSGWEGDGDFPESVFSRVIAPLLVLGAFASVVVAVRALQTGSGDEAVRRRIAVGDIPRERVAVINAVMEDRRLVETLMSQPRRFVTVATSSPRMQRWLGNLKTDRMAAVSYREDTQEHDPVTELRLAEAREIVLLSRSLSDDFDNLELLTTLDAVLNGEGQAHALVEGPEPPAVLHQRHGGELGELVANRLSPYLHDGVVGLGFGNVVRELLVANAAGRLDIMSRIYARPAEARRDDLDRHIRTSGLELSLGVRETSVDDMDPSPGSEVVLGMQVMTTGRPDWRTFAARRARELQREITGTVVLGPPGSHDGAPRSPSRARVKVVGGDGLAQLCARDLAALGVEHVTLLTRPGDLLLPDVTRTGNVHVRRCADEIAVADALLEDDSDGNGDRRDDALLVVESLAETAFDVSRLLERLSIERLHQARTDPGAVTPLYVCCRGPDRARRVRTYVVDEIIDATWAEASYFAVFTNLYLNTMAGSEAIANWPQNQRLAIADRLAQQLCHLELLRPRDLWASEPGAAGRTPLGMTGAEAVREDRRVGPVRGPLIGVLRFEVEADDGQDPVVTARLTVAGDDHLVEDDDLLVCLPCL